MPCHETCSTCANGGGNDATKCLTCDWYNNKHQHLMPVFVNVSSTNPDCTEATAEVGDYYCKSHCFYGTGDTCVETFKNVSTV